MRPQAASCDDRPFWIRPDRHRQLGSFSLGMLRFSIFLLPVFLLAASAALITLYFIDYRLAMTAFGALWMASAVTYIFITSFALLIDTTMGKRPWRSGVTFPGAVNLAIIVAAVATGRLRWLLDSRAAARAPGRTQLAGRQPAAAEGPGGHRAGRGHPRGTPALARLTRLLRSAVYSGQPDSAGGTGRRSELSPNSAFSMAAAVSGHPDTFPRAARRPASAPRRG